MTSADLCQWLKVVLGALVLQPNAIIVEFSESRRGTEVFLKVHVAVIDRGRLVGARGRTVDAIRTLLKAAGGRVGLRVTLQLAEEEGPEP